MAVQARGDLFWRRGGLRTDHNFQPVILAVVFERRLSQRQMQKFVEEHVPSIHFDLRRGLNFSLERGGAQLIWTALDEEETPIRNYLREYSNVVQISCLDSPRHGLLLGTRPPIVSARGNIKGKLHSRVGSRRSQGTTLLEDTSRKLPKDDNGEKNTLPAASSGQLKGKILQVGRDGGKRHMPSASTTSEAIANLKKCQQRGIIIDSSTFLEVLKRCLEQKDLIATRQVHDCIIKSGMDKNPYVANTLLNVYLKCGRLLDARECLMDLSRRPLLLGVS